MNFLSPEFLDLLRTCALVVNAGAFFYLIFFVMPKERNKHEKQMGALQERFVKQIEVLRESQVEHEDKSHEKIIEMCISHDSRMQAAFAKVETAFREIIYAIMLLDPETSPPDREKIRQKLLKDD